MKFNRAERYDMCVLHAFKMKGPRQVYTGHGTGKTTAALGLARRAAGAGLKVCFSPFVKGMKYSEHNALLKFNGYGSSS
jgi:cob(I)alamin adenosyltransferase